MSLRTGIVMAAVGPNIREWINCGATITLGKTDLYPGSSIVRNIFVPIMGVLCFLSLVGNIGTLCVNFQRRRIRPFFRACLFSLALSDLISTVLLTTVYITQSSADYFQIWLLGRNMCKFVPYVSSASILANSITLAAIALDRYLALMNSKLIRRRDPNIVLCTTYIVGIWIVCIATSVPLLYIYKFEWVHVYEEQSVGSSNEADICQVVEAMEVLPMCVSDDRGFGMYYIIFTVLIFSISIISFLWLNTMIARKLWKRRHNITARAGPTSPPFIVIQSELPTRGGEGGGIAEKRKARHFRLFYIILMLMATFICLRLPAWIFLIMRIYASYSEPIHWILYCCFAVLNMFSCVLNPLLYTFLTETLIYVSRLKGHLIKCFTSSANCAYCCDLLNTAKLRCYCIGKIEKKNDGNGAHSVHDTNFERTIDLDISEFHSFYNCNQEVYTIQPELDT